MTGVESVLADGDAGILEYEVQRGHACNVVFYPPSTTASGLGLLSRNYDFPVAGIADLYGQPGSPHALTSQPYLLELHPEGSYASLSMTSYDLIGCLDGVNETGLCVALLGQADVVVREATIPSLADIGLDELLLGRFLLDSCATVEEAQKALAEQHVYYRHLPCHFIVADRSGRCAIYARRLDSGDHGWIEPRWRDTPVVVTNNDFRTEQGLEPGTLSDLHARVELIARGRSITFAQAADVSRCAYASTESSYFGEANPLRTLWHAVYSTVNPGVAARFYLGDQATASGATPAYTGFVRRRLSRSVA
jgi:hypothetical protein